MGSKPSNTQPDLVGKDIHKGRTLSNRDKTELAFWRAFGTPTYIIDFLT